MNNNTHPNIIEILEIYPHRLQHLVLTSLKIIPENRYKRGQKLNASYNRQTGLISLWNPNLQDREELLTILSHEIGHKIFHEI